MFSVNTSYRPAEPDGYASDDSFPGLNSESSCMNFNIQTGFKELKRVSPYVQRRVRLVLIRCVEMCLTYSRHISACRGIGRGRQPDSSPCLLLESAQERLPVLIEQKMRRLLS